MYKLIPILIFCFFFYQQYHYEDLKKYERNELSVEIKGEIKKPGVYKSKNNIDLKTLIQLAGGIKENGDLSSLNQNQILEHQSVIVIPKKLTKVCISINAASVEQLDSLKGIGPVMAMRIVEYRNQHNFQTIEMLMEVKGIGEKLFVKIKDDICL
ncbi:MAG: ComEA family DNA-binding protein [Erysipelotrichaceae bacterium]